jgi:hypothetical protein
MASLDFVVDTFVGSDGSRYYGTLRNGVPSGLGTCIWPNNCHYDGEWRNGVMHGFGTYVWKNGQRYDGEWKVRGAAAGIALGSCRTEAQLQQWVSAMRQQDMLALRIDTEQQAEQHHLQQTGQQLHL